MNSFWLITLPLHLPVLYTPISFHPNPSAHLGHWTLHLHSPLLISCHTCSIAQLILLPLTLLFPTPEPLFSVLASPHLIGPENTHM